MRYSRLFALLGVASAFRFQWADDWCLAVLEGARNRSPLRLEPCAADSPTQEFKFDPLRSQLLWSANPSFCVDILAGCPVNGNQVQLWECQALPDQNHVFSLTDSSVQWTGGPSPAKCLEVTDKEEPRLSYVQIWDCDPEREGQRLIATEHPGQQQAGLLSEQSSDHAR